MAFFCLIFLFQRIKEINFLQYRYRYLFVCLYRKNCNYVKNRIDLRRWVGGCLVVVYFELNAWFVEFILKSLRNVLSIFIGNCCPRYLRLFIWPKNVNEYVSRFKIMIANVPYILYIPRVWPGHSRRKCAQHSVLKPNCMNN